MKNGRPILIVVVLIIGLAVAIWWSNKEDTSNTLYASEINVYNWSFYTSEKVIRNFTKDTGIVVNYSTYNSNEEMLAKIQAKESFDLVVPSDYMIALMKRENLLLPIDRAQLTNINNLDPAIVNKSKAFDQAGSHSVPYMWGTVGIGYNTKYFHQPPSTSDLTDEKLKGKISIIDDPRFAIGFFLMARGSSPNATDDKSLKAVELDLRNLKKSLLDVHSERYISALENEEALAVVGFNGDIYQAADRNRNIRYSIPANGTVLWIDNLAIPVTAKNKSGAMAFINYLLDPRNAAEISNSTRYASANLRAREYIHKDILNDPGIFPTPETLDKCRALEDIDLVPAGAQESQTGTQKIADLWLRFKQM